MRKSVERHAACRGALPCPPRRTSLGVRWTSTHHLDDGVRTLVGSVPTANLSSAPLKMEVLQVDLQTRF